MSHLIIAPLSFFLGALVSWLFMCWRMDKSDEFLTNALMNQYRENDRLTTKNLESTKLIWRLEEKVERCRISQDLATNCIKKLTQELLKYKQQEKENG